MKLAYVQHVCIKCSIDLCTMKTLVLPKCRSSFEHMLHLHGRDCGVILL